MRLNPPAAADTPENLSGGVLLVLLPGFGPEDGGRDPAALTRPRGLLTSAQIDRGPYVPRVLKWLAAAGLDLRSAAPRLQLAVWPEAFEGRPHGPQCVKALVRQSDAFLKTVAERRPRLLVFVSCYLHDAACAPELDGPLTAALGRAIEPPRRLCASRLRVQIQRRERALILALPVPTANATPAFEAELTAALRRELRTIAGGFAGPTLF